MATVEESVLASFFERIAEAGCVPEAVIEELRSVLAAETLPKSDALTQLFVRGSGDTLS